MTITEIARHFAVSAVTVSNALNRKGSRSRKSGRNPALRKGTRLSAVLSGKITFKWSNQSYRTLPARSADRSMVCRINQ